MAKYYLDEPGLERLVDYINNSLANKANIGDIAQIPSDVVRREELDIYALKSDLEDLDVNGLATDEDIERLEGLINGVYHFRGSVADLAALQAVENPAVGDVYNIANTGMNAAWTGTEWDEFGSIVDLTDYLTNEDVQSISMSTLDAILYSGKAAVVADTNGIKAMIDNDEPAVTVVLNEDITGAAPITIPTGKQVTLDLGGNKLAGANGLINVNGGQVILTNGEVESVGRPVIVQSGSVVLGEGAEVTSTNDVAVSASGSTTSVTMNGGKITAQESGILVTSGASLVMNDGEIECTDNCPIQGNGTAGQGGINVVMNGGKLTAHITSAGWTACAVYMPNDGSFTMNGGEIESDGAGVVMRAGQVNLNGGSIKAIGTSGVKGKVGDSKVVVGPYAVVYDESAKYPACATLELNIAEGMLLEGTDGDIDVLLSEGATANINDNR